MGSWLASIISSIIAGAIFGSLARLILPGKQNISVITTILAGMIAAFCGSLIARAGGFHDTKGIDWWELLIQIALALVAVTLAARYIPRRNKSGTPPMTPPGTGTNF